MLLNANWHPSSSLHLWGHRPSTATPAEANAATTSHSLMSASELRAVLGEISSEPLLASVATESTLGLWLPRALVCRDTANDPDHAKQNLVRVTVPTLRFPA